MAKTKQIEKEIEEKNKKTIDKTKAKNKEKTETDKKAEAKTTRKTTTTKKATTTKKTSAKSTKNSTKESTKKVTNSSKTTKVKKESEEPKIKNKKSTSTIKKKVVKEQPIREEIKKQEKNIKEEVIKENIVEEVEENKEALVVENKSEEVIKLDEIKNVIKDKKKMPKEEKKKIRKVAFRNIFVAIGIIIYFLFLSLGYINIDNNIFVTDLKVFSMCILLFAIAIIEVAYKKDNGQLAIYGIEMIVLSIASVSLIYVDLMLSSKFIVITSIISAVFALYYILKATIMYLKKKKAYFINDMKEIIKEEDEE